LPSGTGVRVALLPEHAVFGREGHGPVYLTKPRARFDLDVPCDSGDGERVVGPAEWVV